MDLITAEQQLTILLADKLQLELNREIFYGALPPGVQQGIAVKFTSGQLKNLNAQNQFKAEITGLDTDPEKFQTCLTTLNQLFPLYGINGFTALETSGEIVLKYSGKVREFGLPLLVVFP